MLTLFTTPKPFTGKIDRIQRNAIKSWTLLKPKCEIILLGDEEGAGEVAREFNLTYIPKIKRNEFGTPRLDSVTETAAAASSNRMISYVNTDIILLQDFMTTLMRVRRRRPFLMIGRRWDLDLEAPIDFQDPAWEKHLSTLVREKGTLHAETGIDYFLTMNEFFKRIPPFAIGRTAWDNYLVYKARKEGLDVIDATPTTTVIHQNHDYSHVNPEAGDAWKGLEARRNYEYAGSPDRFFTILDSTHVVGRSQIMPALRYKYLKRRLRASSAINPDYKPLLWFLNRMHVVLWRLTPESIRKRFRAAEHKPVKRN